MKNDGNGITIKHVPICTSETGKTWRYLFRIRRDAQLKMGWTNGADVWREQEGVISPADVPMANAQRRNKRRFGDPRDRPSNF